MRGVNFGNLIIARPVPERRRGRRLGSISALSRHGANRSGPRARPGRPPPAPVRGVSSSRQRLWLSMMALAALLLARQAGQRILHQPDIAALLDGAGSRPRRSAARRAGHGPHRRGSVGPNSATVGAPARGRQMRHRRIGPDDRRARRRAAPRARGQTARRRGGAHSARRARPHRDRRAPPRRDRRSRPRASPRAASAAQARASRRRSTACSETSAPHGSPHRDRPAASGASAPAGAHHLRDPRDAERIGQPQHLLDPMHARRHRHAAARATRA